MGSRLIRTIVTVGACLSASVIASAAAAAVVSWTDWLSSGTNSAAGSLQVGASTVGVTYSGPYAFVQTAGGTNYWNPSTPYISATVSSAPPGTDIVALNSGSPPTKTITFSEAVVDPLIALVSWNGNTVDFGTPIEILSFGQGFWGTGTPVLNGTGSPWRDPPAGYFHIDRLHRHERELAWVHGRRGRALERRAYDHRIAWDRPGRSVRRTAGRARDAMS
jgi:hypothetical protein